MCVRLICVTSHRISYSYLNCLCNILSSCCTNPLVKPIQRASLLCPTFIILLDIGFFQPTDKERRLNFLWMEMESINGLPGGFPGFTLYSDFPSVWIVVLSYCRKQQRACARCEQGNGSDEHQNCHFDPSWRNFSSHSQLFETRNRHAAPAQNYIRTNKITRN
jgi:hypothetical protein